MFAIVGLILGIALGIYLEPTLPVGLQPYLPIAIVAALDALFGGFRAYLYQSARHMALRLLHKKRARNCFSLDALTEEPEARELVEETVQSAERARLLRTCMAELHEDYREALFLVYFEGLSHAETAAVMGKREKQVADLIYRGKIALRKRLEQEGITDAYNG